jgi:serine/threonine-protein kinase HipA
MARTLDVYLRGQMCGHFTQDDSGQTSFSYIEEWIQGTGAMPLSQSLPIRREPFTRKECAGFFGGMLPEQTQRDVVAGNLGISKKNDFAMLELIGGDCAGAVTFIRSGEELPNDDHDYRPLATHELAEVIRQLPSRPLLAGEAGVRLSLAGAQTKLAVYVENGVISIPLGGAPSSHILKPAIKRFGGIVFNEALCMKLATLVGIQTAPVVVQQVDGLDFLLITRYDRRAVATDAGYEVTERLHQEDFCQALGIISEMKYQAEGGPSLKQSFDLLRRASTRPVVDLRAMLDIVIFNFLIGNHDAHGKNFSLLYEGASSAHQTRLAPFYDLISTTYYPDLSDRMAMKIGGEYDSRKIFLRHFERLADESGLSKSLAVRRVPELANLILERLPMLEQDEYSVQIAGHIRDRCQRTLDRF